MSNNKYFIFFFFILGLLLLGVFGYMFTDLKYLGGTFKNVSNTPTYTQADVEDLFNKGDFANLNRTLDEQLLSYPRDTFLLLQKAHALSQEASLTFKEKELGDQALIYIDQILAIDPDNFEALTLKGYVYEIQQDYVKAHRYYDQVLKLDPTNTKALSQKAHAYDLEGKLVQSEELYKAALKKTPVSEEVIVRYSRILLSKGKIGDAQLLLQENIKSIKNNRLKSETYYLLGNFLQTDTYQKEAYDYFVLAQEADPTYAMSLVGLSQEKFKLGLDDTSGNRDSLFNEALELLSQALKLNPNQSLASLELARQAISMGNLEFGMKVLKNTLVNLENDITLGSGEKVWLKSVINDLINEYK